MTSQQQRDELYNIVKAHLSNKNPEIQDYNAKLFLDWTTIEYSDLLVHEGFYNILVHYFIPSLTDGEVENIIDEIYSFFFNEQNYDNYDYLMEESLLLNH